MRGHWDTEFRDLRNGVPVPAVRDDLLKKANQYYVAANGVKTAAKQKSSDVAASAQKVRESQRDYQFSRTSHGKSHLPYS